MKKLLLSSLVLFICFSSKAQFYKLRYDSIGIVSPLLLGGVTQGGASDSVLVKKANGRVYKVARSSFGSGSGTVSSFSKTDGYGITSSVTNPTTTPNHTVAVDTTSGTGLVSKTRLANTVSGKANLSGGNTFTGSQQFNGAITTTFPVTISDLGETLVQTGGYTSGTTTGGELVLTEKNTAVSPTRFSATLRANDQSVSSVSLKMPLGSGTLARLEDNPTLNNYTASGTGAATTIVVPHGASGMSGTSKVIVQPLNAASAGILYATIDATNVNVVYNVAPANGTNNLSYSILIKP